MKRFCLLFIPAALAACANPNDPGLTQHATVFWMEWPAAVRAGQQFSVRVVIPPLCTSGRLVVRESSTHDTLAFDARWERIRPREWGCEPAGPIYDFTTVDATPVTGPARSIALQATGLEAGSLRNFGRIDVVDGVAGDRLSGAGRARLWSETAACARIQPLGIGSGIAHSLPSYQLAGAARDTALVWVEGYFSTGTTACTRGAADTLIFNIVEERALR